MQARQSVLFRYPLSTAGSGVAFGASVPPRRLMPRLQASRAPDFIRGSLPTSSHDPAWSQRTGR